MRIVLFVVAVVIGMVLLGWITFRRSSDQAAITIETKVMEHDARRTVEAVRDAAAKGVNSVKEGTSQSTATHVD